MGIKLEDQALLLTLDKALALARSKEELPEVWSARVKHLGNLGVKTYIAALGGALLAKATDPRVDSLAQDEAAGPSGYSLRKVTEFLSQQNNGRYHLGAQGRWPLNNRPFLGGPSRIDEFSKISGRAKPAFEAFLDDLQYLNRLDRPQARKALAAFLRVRMEAQEAQRAASRQAQELDGDLPLDDLIRLVDMFVRADPEGGRRAQALTAAVLDCAFEEVDLQPINSPHPGDVRVLIERRIALVAEVKQLPVGEDIATNLSREAVALGADLALLVVISPQHEPLDRERVQRVALRDDSTLLVICESALELISSVSAFSATPASKIARRLPGTFAVRLRELEVRGESQEKWRQLVAARS